ncbi:Trk family potassium transport protein [Bacillus freudenreichii]|nr:Trk family potassium transport protein [Bacillus freudenreichii]
MDFDVIVVGGGQAGLSVGYYLKKAQKQFLILDDQKETGDSWKNRYDSLVLFTPRSYSSLPGLKLPGNPEGYPTKNEVAGYLIDYTEHFELPIYHNAKVVELLKDKEAFIIKTSRGDVYRTRQVVVASGAFHKPYIPPITDSISKGIIQIHAYDYRNHHQIPSGKVLVVGAGNSGVQIAAELSDTHNVILSCSKKIKALPQMMLGKSLFWWLDNLGLLNVKAHSALGKWLKRNDPIIGNDLKKVKRNALIVDRLVDFNNNTAVFANQTKMEVHAIIWATGYRNDYRWIKIGGVLDKNNLPIHQRGVSDIQGLYFIGLSWQHKRGSALIHGVGEDAEYLVNVME